MSSINPLTTSDLNKVLKSNSVTKGIYLGSFPSCIKPRTEKKMYAYISNTDNHNHGGQHWCAWFIKDECISFFDSFGRKPWDPTFPSHFHDIVADYTCLQYTDSRLQNWTSVTCGYFCIHFIYSLCLGLEYKNFLSEYCDDNLISNDYITFDFYNSII